MWIAGQILNYLLGKASDAIQTAAQQIADDKARGEINDANVKAYEDANDRASRIKSSLDLLNRVSRA